MLDGFLLLAIVLSGLVFVFNLIQGIAEVVNPSRYYDPTPGCLAFICLIAALAIRSTL